MGRHRPRVVITPQLMSGRDEIEQRQVLATLSVLSVDHPARLGAEAWRPTTEITRLVADRAELLQPLLDAMAAGRQRHLEKTRADHASSRPVLTKP